jgi:hypothetical protein
MPGLKTRPTNDSTAYIGSPGFRVPHLACVPDFAAHPQPASAASTPQPVAHRTSDLDPQPSTQYCFNHTFLNSTFIGSPTCIWNPIRPLSARPLASSSINVLVTWPFRISVIMLPRAMMCT